jgi:glycosyltransferase involved in cell wall biosynthesis
MPLVTVIIPVYNGEKTLRETLCSVFSQTFQDYELIVVNDGSTDQTLNILQSFSDSRLRIITTPNQGLAATRNMGIRHAQGEYLSFIDADDLWTPDKLESQLAALLKDNAGAGVAYSWTCPLIEHKTCSPRSVYFSGHVYNHLILENFIASGSNILVRKALVEEVGGFDETLCCCEDWEFYLRLAAVTSFAVVPKGQILYRITSTSMSSKVKMVEEHCRSAVGRAAKARNISLPKVYGYLYISLARVFLSRACRIQDLLPVVRAFFLAFVNYPTVYGKNIEAWVCLKSFLYKAISLLFRLKQSDIDKLRTCFSQIDRSMGRTSNSINRGNT